MTSRETAPRRPRHVFIAGRYTNHRDQPLCGHNDCGQLRMAACHQLPDVDPEVAEQEQRRLGERTEP